MYLQLCAYVHVGLCNDGGGETVVEEPTLGPWERKDLIVAK